MDHPMIAMVNRTGHYFPEPIKISSCSSCNGELHKGEEIIEWDNDYFCDTDCLVEFFLENKVDFGVLTKKL